MLCGFASGPSRFATRAAIGTAETPAAPIKGLIGRTRRLSLVLGSTTHSCELMLSAFIAGLAFGGFWMRKRIGKIASPILFSGFMQLVMGLLAFATILVYI